MNSVILVGRLGKEVEIIATQDNKEIAKMRICTGYKDKTDWHSVVVFGKAVAVCKNYLKKGSIVAVRGEIKYQEYIGKDGQKKHATSINCFDVTLCDSRDRSAPAQKVETKPVDWY